MQRLTSFQTCKARANSLKYRIMSARTAKMTLFTFAVSVALFLSAGSRLQAQVFFGMKHGANLGFQLGYDSGDMEPGLMVGYSGGFQIAISLTRDLIIQPEFLYSVKGRGLYLPSYLVRVYLTYLDFPVVMKIRVLKSPITWLLYVGPHVSLALDVNVSEESFYGDSWTSVSTDQMTGFDVGLAVETELGIPFDGHRIFLDLRYITGIVPAIRDEKARNQVVSIYLGYGFTL